MNVFMEFVILRFSKLSKIACIQYTGLYIETFVHREMNQE